MPNRPAVRSPVLLLTVCAALSAALACARTDLGSTCHLQDAVGAEIQRQPGREYLYLGSSECGSFACLATPGGGAPYCSQSCSGVGANCPAGLTCAQLSLSSDYLTIMQHRLSVDEYQALFGQLGSPFYCVRSQ